VSATTILRYRPARLAWSIPPEDQRRFRRILWSVLLLCALFGLSLPWLPRPQPDREHPEELPPRLAKLLLEHEAAPPIVIPKAPEPEAVKKPEKPPEKTTETKAAEKPLPQRPPGEIVEAARRKAASTGLLAMKDELAEIRDKPLAVQMNQDIKQGPGVGTGTGAGVGAGNGPGLPGRSLITSNATGGSGGINTARYSRDTGGAGLAGRNTTLVEGGVAGGGGGANSGRGAGGSLQRGGGGKASRSIEEIKLVFEKNKGAIYAIYNRALREDPTLEGKVVLELKIAPSGDVLDARILSSELKAPELEKKLLGRIKQFDFGAKDVEVMVVTWPVDFLPS
jgi:protein TonB